MENETQDGVFHKNNYPFSIFNSQLLQNTATKKKSAKRTSFLIREINLTPTDPWTAYRRYTHRS